MLLLSFVDFSNLLFEIKILSGTISECQTVCFQIRTDVLSALIRVQSVCKEYQQRPKVAISKERIKHYFSTLPKRIKSPYWHQLLVWLPYLDNKIYAGPVPYFRGD